MAKRSKEKGLKNKKCKKQKERIECERAKERKVQREE